MRAIYLEKKNSQVKWTENEEKHFPDIIDTTATVMPIFYYYRSWLDGVKGGFKENFDMLDMAEDGVGEEREAIESLRTEFFKTFVQVELHISEQYEKELKLQGADHVVVRPTMCYVLNVWGNSKLTLSDIFKNPKDVIKELAW